MRPLLPQLLEDMEETCLSVRGVGLSANQIGLDYRMAVILIPESDKKNAPLKRIVIINPEMGKKGGEMGGGGGALSRGGLGEEPRGESEGGGCFKEKNAKKKKVRAGGFLDKFSQQKRPLWADKIFINKGAPFINPAIKKEIKKLPPGWDCKAFYKKNPACLDGFFMRRRRGCLSGDCFCLARPKTKPSALLRNAPNLFVKKDCTAAKFLLY